MHNPIIFLNIDGVLISEDYILNNSNNLSNLYRINNSKIYIKFEDDKIKLLKGLVNEFNAYIILVSYWCLSNSLDDFKDMFKEYDLDSRIIDVVPYMPIRSGDRIYKWKNIKKIDIDNNNFVIFDNEDVGKYIDKHICCNPKVGLTEDNINKAKQLLKK